MNTARRLHVAYPLEPAIFVRQRARQDPRIRREMKTGRLVYWASVNGQRIEHDDIVKVYEQLPA